MATHKKDTKKGKKIKKTAKKSMKKIMMVATDDRCFWTHDGPVLRNLSDLAHAFTKITNDQYKYHVNKQKNDFAAWVEFVLLDPECARALRKVKSRIEARASVLKAIKSYR